MTDTKVTITDDDIYGVEVLSPDFKPDIKVKFALDIPQSKKRILVKLANDVKKSAGLDISKMSEAELAEYNANNTKYGELIVQTIVLDWNLYDSDGNKLVISADTLDNKLNTGLAKWITDKALGFFITPDKKQEIKN